MMAFPPPREPLPNPQELVAHWGSQANWPPPSTRRCSSKLERKKKKVKINKQINKNYISQSVFFFLYPLFFLRFSLHVSKLSVIVLQYQFPKYCLWFSGSFFFPHLEQTMLYEEDRLRLVLAFCSWVVLVSSFCFECTDGWDWDFCCQDWGWWCCVCILDCIGTGGNLLTTVGGCKKVIGGTGAGRIGIGWQAFEVWPLRTAVPVVLVGNTNLKGTG